MNTNFLLLANLHQLNDQSHQPRKHDIISFWDQDHWSQVHVINKVKGSYYNCQRETCETIGIYLTPATTSQSYFWSLTLQLRIDIQEIICSDANYPPIMAGSPGTPPCLNEVDTIEADNVISGPHEWPENLNKVAQESLDLSLSNLIRRSKRT